MYPVLQLTSKTIRNYLCVRKPLWNNAVNCSNLSTSPEEIKITICGALGQVGKSLSVLLKQSPYIDELRLYDVKDTKDLATDLNLNFAKCKVIGCDGVGNEKEVFEGANAVVIVAAKPGSNSLSCEQMFNENKNIICSIADIYSTYCPKAIVAVASHPVNSFVPLLSQELKAKGVYDFRKVLGITSFYSERASKYTSEMLGYKTERIDVPIIGGGIGKTVVPLLSTIDFPSEIYYDDLEEIATVLQEEADVRQSGPAAAFAIAKFVKSLVWAMKGRTDIVECAYVRSDSVDGLKYLCTPLLLGPEGIHKNFGIPSMTLFEQDMFTNAIKILKEDIKRGELEEKDLKCL